MGYVTQEYLAKQFKNYSNVVKDTFSKKKDAVAEKIAKYLNSTRV